MKTLLQWSLFATVALVTSGSHAARHTDTFDCVPDGGKCLIPVTVMPSGGTHAHCYGVVDYQTTFAHPADGAKRFVWEIANDRRDGFKFVDNPSDAIKLHKAGAERNYDQVDDDGSEKRRIRLRIVGAGAADTDYELHIEQKRGGAIVDTCDPVDPVIAND